MSYTIPTGVDYININAVGAGGGSGSVSSSGNGGNGGNVNVNFSVLPGDIINYYLGFGGDFGGGSDTNASTIVVPSNIIDGLANDVRCGGKISTNGGGGGAITCITLTRDSSSSILIIAGGGGGGGGTNGGNGGDSTSSNSTGSNGGGNNGGKGATSEGTGGNGGNSSSSNGIKGIPFSIGIGGDNYGSLYGGGGGGGYGGGGGGYGPGHLNGGGGGNYSTPPGSGGGGGGSYVNSTFVAPATFTLGTPITVGGDGKGGVITNNQPSQGNQGGITITPNADPSPSCFFPGTRILTAGGYVPVEDLQKGDTVMTLRGSTEIVEMVKFTSNTKKHPLYVLPKDVLGLDMPIQPLYMSHNHAFKYKGLWHHMKCSPFTQPVTVNLDEDSIVYYHIIVEDYFKYTITAENVEVETCFKYDEGDNVMMVWSCNKVCCRPIRATRGLGGKMRAEFIALPDGSFIGAESDSENDSESEVEIEPEVVVTKRNSVNMTAVNRGRIQQRMGQPFDPRRDTYQMIDKPMENKPITRPMQASKPRHMQANKPRPKQSLLEQVTQILGQQQQQQQQRVNGYNKRA